ncbi:pectin lyase fold/virulence factor [Dactylonectria macrodidyma]|uniref:Pectinesterase n=1 Tax=Dactylonectria macrodidyma TaxID=307937 RepID=A0A9P9F5J1_9HYPO|nr:pectin lyase fold/virulence factor [Dactylonectria macrodidyma]
MLVKRLLVLVSILSGSVAKSCKGRYARTQPASGALVVDGSGEYKDSFGTLGEAVTALNTTTLDEQVIFVLPGTYKEQVYIGPLAGPLKVQGYTCDTRSYADNQVTLTNNISRQSPNITKNDETATLRLWSAGVKLYNLDVANTFGAAATSGQALALSAQNTDQGFYGCRFEGWQDTIYANEGRQIYARTYISGAVDFIFGLRAAAWFEDCDIDVLGDGYITANGRDSADNDSFYVFNQCRVSGSAGVASTYLGRPWRTFSRVVFQKTALGDVVHPEGWSRWDSVQSVDDVVYGEYKNRGVGAQGVRANFSSQLPAPVKITELMGATFTKEWWVDKKYL